MILTVKAKEDFLKWCKQDTDFMQTYEDIYLFALIIEWMDSVGIYVEIFNEFGWFGFIIHGGDWKNPYESSSNWKNRKEATEQGIIKANKIYNEINRFKSR